MKKFKIIFLIFLISLCSSKSFSQVIDQATLDKSIEKGNKEIINSITKSSSDLSNVIKASVKPVSPPIKTINPNDNTTPVIIAFLPVVLFILIILVLLIKSNRNDITLREILLDKDMQLITKKEEAKAKANAVETYTKAMTAQAVALKTSGVADDIIAKTLTPDPVTPDPVPANDNQQQSVSRLIALISGITSVALAACIATFYMYRWSLGDSNPDIGHLSSILYGLGLGVIPYGVNKVASVLRG